MARLKSSLDAVTVRHPGDNDVQIAFTTLRGDCSQAAVH